MSDARRPPSRRPAAPIFELTPELREGIRESNERLPQLRRMTELFREMGIPQAQIEQELDILERRLGVINRESGNQEG